MSVPVFPDARGVVNESEGVTAGGRAGRRVGAVDCAGVMDDEVAGLRDHDVLARDILRPEVGDPLREAEDVGARVGAEGTTMGPDNVAERSAADVRGVEGEPGRGSVAGRDHEVVPVLMGWRGFPRPGGLAEQLHVLADDRFAHQIRDEARERARAEQVPELRIVHVESLELLQRCRVTDVLVVDVVVQRGNRGLDVVSDALAQGRDLRACEESRNDHESVASEPGFPCRGRVGSEIHRVPPVHGGHHSPMDPEARLEEATTQRVALIGWPFDHHSSFRRGSAAAPPLIRAEIRSDVGNPWSETGVDVCDAASVLDAGDVVADPEEGAHAALTAAVGTAVTRGMAPVVLGGDHAATWPILQGVAGTTRDVTILHVDAHPDLYDDFEGDPRSHASPFARIMEEGLARRLVQVGIRTLNPHQRAQVDRFGVEVFEMRDLSGLATLRFEGPLYVSVDLDGIDPGEAPGVSHPEPGGLSTRQVIDLIQTLPRPLIGADVVEYNPERDVLGLTARVAAKLAKELIAACHP